MVRNTRTIDSRDIYSEPPFHARSHFKGRFPIFSQLPQYLSYEGLQHHFSQAIIYSLAVHRRHQFLDRDTCSPPAPRVNFLAFDIAKCLQDLFFTSHFLGQLTGYFGRQVKYHSTMSGVAHLTVERLHLSQRRHIGAKFLYSATSMTEDIIPRKHSIFFLQNKTHVIVGVPWRVYGTNSGPFNGERFAVHDWFLASTGRVFVYCSRKMGIELKEVRYPASMIAVPVSQEYMGQRDA